MTETTRIRWEDKTPGNGDVYRIAHLGYIGTVEGAAFIIYTPDEMHADWLLSVRLVPGGTFFYDVSAEALKAEAEEWLAGFVSSLGAIFPGDGGYDFGDEDEDGEPLAGRLDVIRAHADLDGPRFNPNFTCDAHVPRLLKAVEAALEKADDLTRKSEALDAEAEYVAGEHPEAAAVAVLKRERSIAYDECARWFREAITTALGGTQQSEDGNRG